MNREMKVNRDDYSKEMKIRCEKCRSHLLVMIHKNFKECVYVLGCAFCGHKNEMKLGKDE